MHKILIFAGTTEGRQTAEFCAKHHIHAAVCTATEYGAKLIPDSEYLTIFPGRMDCIQMFDFLREQNTKLVIDATHPYAVEVTCNVRKACAMTGVRYVRLLRERTEEIHGETVRTIPELIQLLNQNDDIILSTLGSNALEDLTKVRDYQSRIWVRVLAWKDAYENCRKLGYQHIIAATPEISVASNIRHIQESGAKILITKESGNAGGYPEKIQAAEICQIRTITLIRPQETGLNPDEVKQILLRELP